MPLAHEAEPVLSLLTNDRPGGFVEGVTHGDREARPWTSLSSI
jgi:hypothetical protein